MEMLQDDPKERGVGAPGAASILDVLNADCWRLVLDRLTVNDIVRSERVSRAWQRVVLEYLPGIRNFEIEPPDKFNPYYYNIKNIYRIIVCPEPVSFVAGMIRKMGPYWVTVLLSNCINKEYINDALIDIALHCPKLESLTLVGAGFSTTKTTNFTITGKTPEEIANNASLKNLKTLALSDCGVLLSPYVQAVVKHLGELTRLELNECYPETLEDLHLFLNETPKLEHLSLMDYRDTDYLNSEVLPSLGRLVNLRELCLWANYSVGDEWLAAVARGCPELRSVNVGATLNLSPGGVVELCRARPTLVELVVALKEDFTEEQLEECARCCGGLELLDMTWCGNATQGLLRRLARPRARPLRLRVYETSIKKDEVHYEGLTLDWSVQEINDAVDFRDLSRRIQDVLDAARDAAESSD